MGMAVALLVTLSLLFSAAQVYRVSSASAEIQEVADAAALAAESKVAEFMVAVRLCDAVVLTLSLTGISSQALGVVALCVPPVASLGEKLVELGGRVLDARDSFAEWASSGLNSLQRSLPFLSAASAAAVGSANGGGAGKTDYRAIALLVPSEGADMSIGADGASNAARAFVEEGAGPLREAAELAEEAAEEAEEAKARAFARDCGDDPAYCMYERASSLSPISTDDNPLYQSVDAWSFSVALNRAKAYYEARLEGEIPLSGSVAQRANSALRKTFYAYAAKEVSRGYASDAEGSFEAYFPLLPKNTSEMKETSLYTDEAYPLTTDGSGARMLHAWPGCPSAVGYSGLFSLAFMDEEDFSTCPDCEFTAASLGKVAAASTSIENGFEYHYNAVAEAAADYAAARSKLDPLALEVKSRAGGLFSACEEALRSVGSKRIDATPPGAKGAIALVVDLSASPAQAGFESSFVADAGTLGTRAAVAGATLLEEEGEEGETVITSLLDGLAQDGGSRTGAARVVLDCWSALLGAYAKGQQALESAVERALDAIPLVSRSGLGSWAAEALSSCVAAVGLEPANLNALKPVLVNSAHVARAGDDGISARFLSVRESALSVAGSSPSVFSSVLDGVEERAFEALGGSDGKVEIARIDFPGGDAMPITIVLPDSVRRGAAGAVSSALDAVRSAYGQVTGVKPWR